jgi:F-type H+-transporting ATPase subunit delta
MAKRKQRRKVESAAESAFDEAGQDVGRQRVAAVYAKALVDAAQNAGQTASVLEELGSLLGDVFNQFPRFEAILRSWLVPHDQTVGILDRTFAGRMSPLLLNFLKVLSRHGRLDVLRQVEQQARLLWDQMRGRIRVELVTAAPVDPVLLDRINQGLQKALGGEPIIQQIVDSDVIGGAVLRIGDTVYDGSLANQLENLRQQMIDRSVHEIQSRRDRFRYPAGNRAV